MACHSLPELVAAVRSFAVDEDGATASFAGQHETYLNIVGADSIVQAVNRCWESARSERALEYRRQQGLSVERLHLAVLVQQLVAADVSAVVFSANPITGNRDEIVINASWGLRREHRRRHGHAGHFRRAQSGPGYHWSVIVEQAAYDSCRSGRHQRGRCAALLARPALAE
jgi:hypothetical protein